MASENGGQAPPGVFGRIREWVVRHRFKAEIGLFLTVLLIVYFWKSIFITVHAGELGVYFKRFGGGTVLDKPPFSEGLHVIYPWDKIEIYNVREQQVTHEFHVLSQDGLRIDIFVSIRYHPHRDIQLNHLHQELGPDYLEAVIIPEVEAALRMIIGKYEPAELYQAEYGLLESALSESLLQLTEEFVTLDDLLITRLVLPQMVQEAIEDKLREQHNAQKYKYILMQAEEEAKRKVILATGIRDFQDIVGEGISPQLLRWRGIEATLALAQSPNAKIVIIGGPQDGLPLILNTGDMAAPPAAHAAAALPLSASAAGIHDSTAVPRLLDSIGTEFSDLIGTLDSWGGSEVR